MNFKKIFQLPLLAAMLFAGYSAQVSAGAPSDEVLLTIDGEPIMRSEFEYVYNKNNSVSSSEKKTIEEYLELFINYKLKVQDAKDSKLDELGSYTRDYEQYREQTALPFLIDADSKNNLVREVYERSKKRVAASHILIKFDRKDSVPPLTRIYQIQRELKNGADFAELAKQYSDCPSGKRSGGYLGYFNVFDMVYDFENVAFNMKPGEISDPFRTKFGYHIVKVVDVIPNVTEKRVSQIFISNSNPRAKEIIDSLKRVVEINEGLNFHDLAKKYNSSKMNGDEYGRLPWIQNGSQLLPPDVVRMIMDTEKGEITQMSSPMGYHLFKLDSTNLDIPYEKKKAEIQERVLKSDRAGLITRNFLSGLKRKYDVRIDTANLYQFLPYCVSGGDIIPDLKANSHKFTLPLYYVEEEVYSQQDFLPIVDKERNNWIIYKSGHGSPDQKKKFGRIKSDSIFLLYCLDEYLKKELVSKSYEGLQVAYPEYKNQLQEYSDGLLLFSASERKVWQAATANIKGLQEHFKANQEKYKWTEPRFRGLVVHSKSVKIKNQVEKFFDSVSPEMPLDSLKRALDREFNKDKNNKQIKVRKGTFAKGTNNAIDHFVFKSAPVLEVSDALYPEVSIFGSETTEPVEMSEVRGAVVSDVQDKLEKEWVERLRKEHKVVVNKSALKHVKK